MNISMEKKRLGLEFRKLLCREHQFFEISGCLGLVQERCERRGNGKGQSQKPHLT